MLQWHPHQVVIITPSGIVVVARRLYECLEGWMHPDDVGLIRDFDWWRQLSQHVGCIQITTLVPLGRKHLRRP
jgi:hypothetical protein